MSETFSAQVKRKAKYIDKIQWTKTLKRKNLTKKIKKQWQFFLPFYSICYCPI